MYVDLKLDTQTDIFKADSGLHLIVSCKVNGYTDLLKVEKQWWKKDEMERWKRDNEEPLFTSLKC